MIDIARLDRALDHIDAHPELHQQGEWLVTLDCGTGGCLAGWVVLQEYPEAELVRTWADEPGYFSHVKAGEEVISVPFEAARLLGVNEDQSLALFTSENTIGQLRAMRDALADNPAATWDELVGVADWSSDGVDE